jgi:hypothetical protein
MACGGKTLVHAVMFKASNTVPSKAAERPHDLHNERAEVASNVMMRCLKGCC